MTSISAGAPTRVHRTRATGLVLALIAVLLVDNHVMPLPGASFAEIGIARSLLDHAASAHAQSSGWSAHDLHRCFVQARRSGQDPVTCRAVGR